MSIDRTRLEAGTPVVFVNPRGRQHYLVLEPGYMADFSGHRIRHNDVIGLADGSRVESDRGRPFQVFRATLRQHIKGMKRHAQIVYPKDLAIMLHWADVYAGAKVVEGGFGSGAMSMALCEAVGPTGHVTTYELREEAANRSSKNMRQWFGGDCPWHTLKMGDIYQGIEEREVDRVILDVPEPWNVVIGAAHALRTGGIFCAYVPTVLQLQRVVLGLEHSRRYHCIESLETLLRPWFVKSRSVRPDQRMIGHTGFLVFARRGTDPPPRPDGEGEEEADAQELEAPA